MARTGQDVRPARQGRGDARPPRGNGPPAASSVVRLGLAAAVAIAVVGGFALGRISLFVAAGYVVMGGLSALTYAIDKQRSRQGAWRIPESRLHAVDFCGGIVGGAIAQSVLQHKTRKPAFQVATDLIAVAHLVGLALLELGIVVLPWLR